MTARLEQRPSDPRLLVPARPTLGKTVVTTPPVSAALRGFVRRNVAVNKLTTPSPAITLPMMAIMASCTSSREETRPGERQFSPG